MHLHTTVFCALLCIFIDTNGSAAVNVIVSGRHVPGRIVAFVFHANKWNKVLCPCCFYMLVDKENTTLVAGVSCVDDTVHYI